MFRSTSDCGWGVHPSRNPFDSPLSLTTAPHIAILHTMSELDRQLAIERATAGRLVAARLLLTIVVVLVR